MKTAINMTSRQLPSGKRLWHFIAIAMPMVMLCSVLLVAFHHHDDAQDHDDDCAICAVAHHRTADIAITFPDVSYIPFSFPVCFASLNLAIVISGYTHSPQERAPPLNQAYNHRI
jgi:hypothetical protein